MDGLAYFGESPGGGDVANSLSKRDDGISPTVNAFDRTGDCYTCIRIGKN